MWLTTGTCGACEHRLIHQVPYGTGNVLTSWLTISFSLRTRIHRIVGKMEQLSSFALKIVISLMNTRSHSFLCMLKPTGLSHGHTAVWGATHG
jgi:hypothetical protein